MRNMQVQWGNGQFLRPQHFQSQERFWDEQLRTSEQFDHHFHYGVRELDFDQDALRNQQLQITRLKARMRDGTLVSLDEGQQLDRLDLQAAFIKAPLIRVFLAIPKFRAGEANLAPEPGQGKRFLPRAQTLPDETQGGKDHEVKFRWPNYQLLIEGQDMSGFEILPLVEIERAGDQAAVPRLKLDAVPPLLACDGWPPLYRITLRGLYDRIGKRIEVLRNQVISHGITLVSEEPLDAERIHMLSYLNMAYARLGVLAFTKGVHPWNAYLELCTIAGMLSIFHPERRLPNELPRYDHDRLGPLFDYVRRLIEYLLEIIPQPEYEMRYFFGVVRWVDNVVSGGRPLEPYFAPHLMVELKPEWFNSDWEWYVGVHKGELSDSECDKLLGRGDLDAGAQQPSMGGGVGDIRGAMDRGALDWKIGATLAVEQIFLERARGLSLVRTPVPRALPRKQDWVYFQIRVEGNREHDPVLKKVLTDRTLAMRFSDQLIRNRDEARKIGVNIKDQQTHYLWQNQKDVVVAWNNREITLQFCLFAVKKAQAQVRGQMSQV